jgi:hypothetical protein
MCDSQSLILRRAFFASSAKQHYISSGRKKKSLPEATNRETFYRVPGRFLNPL